MSEEHATSTVSVIGAFSPSHNKLNWLLIAVPITAYFSLISKDTGMSFLFSMIAIMPLALLMGHATEEIALRTSESLGGLLNATFGNAVEIIIATLAIKIHKIFEELLYLNHKCCYNRGKI